MKRSSVLFFNALVAVAYVACKPPQPINPPPDADSGFVDPPALDGAQLDTCGRACAVLRAQPCREGMVNAVGESCETICRRDKAEGYGAALNADCVAGAKSLDALHACNVRCLP